MRGATYCSGIGAPEAAAPEIEWLSCAEVDKFASSVHAERFGTPNLGDVTAADFLDRAASYGPLDLLVAGTPCQAFSVAGLRQSLSDNRGNITLEFVRAVKHLRPVTVVWENVPGVLSTADNAFGCFLAGLVGADTPLEPVPYSHGSRWWRKSRRPIRWKERFWPVWPDAGVVVGPERRAAWRILDAQYFGLAQRRERVFVVASLRDGPDPSEVLFEREGVQRNSPPSRETRQRVARGVETGFTPSSHGAYVEGSGALRRNGGDLGGGSEVLMLSGRYAQETAKP